MEFDSFTARTEGPRVGVRSRGAAKEIGLADTYQHVARFCLKAAGRDPEGARHPGVVPQGRGQGEETEERGRGAGGHVDDAGHGDPVPAAPRVRPPHQPVRGSRPHLYTAPAATNC